MILVWRIFTGTLVHPELLMLLFSLMSYIPTAIVQEKLDGSLKQTIRFLTTSALVGIITSLIAFLL